MDNDKIKRGYELIEKGYNDFIRLVEDDKNFIKYILGLSTGSIVFTITFYQGFSNSKLIIPGLIFMLLTIIVGLFGIRFPFLWGASRALDWREALWLPTRCSETTQRVANHNPALQILQN